MAFLDVGQGDGAVIETPSGKVVVIDAGGVPGTDERLGGDPGTRVVVPYLRWRGVSTVDLVVATHPDDDHVQGLSAVSSRLSVRAALDSGLPSPPDTPMSRLRDLWARKRVPVQTARRGQRIDLGDGASLEVLHPAEKLLNGTRSDDNNNAIVLRLVYGKARILFTADAEEDAERALLNSGADLSADVLKVGHHGSRWSTSDAFLKKVNPSVAILSCGRDNRFGHPHKETLARLEAQGAKVYRTDQQGALTLETDGQNLKITPYLSPAR